MKAPAPKRKRVKLRAGDLFELQVSDGRYGYGLVIIPGGVLYAAFFRHLYHERPHIEAVISDEIALVGWTMDALFYHDRWIVITRDQPVPADIPFPDWKVGIQGELHATDFDGQNARPIRPEEIEFLDYRFSWSPMVYVDALEALNGLGEWDDRYIKATPAYASRRMTRAWIGKSD